MRFDKLTTPFQSAIQDAQSLALGNDNPYIEPVHLLAALINQEGGSARPILQKAGARLPVLVTALQAAMNRLPKVEGTGGEIQPSRDLVNLFNLTDKEASKRGDQFIASELFLLAAVDDKGEAGRLLRENGATRRALEAAIQEVRARGALIVAIAEEGDQKIVAFSDHIIRVPVVPTLMQPLVSTVPLQVFACEMATAKGHDVDQPRNLAKSVPVE